MPIRSLRLRSAIIGLVLACQPESATGPTTGAEKTPQSPQSGVSAMATTMTMVDQGQELGTMGALALGSNRLHVVYFDRANGAFKFASCARNCTFSGSWNKGAFAQVGGPGGGRVSLAVAASGRRFLTYYDPGIQGLRFSVCEPTSTCTTPGQWSKVRIDPANDVGGSSSLVLGSDGSKHVSYGGNVITETPQDVKYAVCLSACTAAANWTRVVVDRAPSPTGYRGDRTSLAIGPDGRLHMAYFNTEKHDLKYATCSSSCTLAGNWQKLTIDGLDHVGLYASLVAASDGVLHLTYFDLTHGNLKYARCAFDCTTASSWKKVVILSAGEVGWDNSLSVESNGRVHVSAYSNTETALYYATCNADCTVSSSWTRSRLDGAFSSVGLYTSLAALNGVVHIIYNDWTNQSLKYLRRSP